MLVVGKCFEVFLLCWTFVFLLNVPVSYKEKLQRCELSVELFNNHRSWKRMKSTIANMNKIWWIIMLTRRSDHFRSVFRPRDLFFSNQRVRKRLGIVRWLFILVLGWFDRSICRDRRSNSRYQLILIHFGANAPLKLRSRKCVMISLIYLQHRNILIRNCHWSKKMKNIFLKHIFFSLKIRELSEKTGPEAWKRL